MRDYGIHVVPNVTTLPGSGVAGQQVCYQGQVYYWNTTYLQWLQIDDWFESPLTATYTNATTTLSTIFSVPLIANAIYAFEWKLIWQASAAIAFKQAIVVPSGTFNALSEITAVANGTTAPSYHQLATSGTAQVGPTAGVAATNYFSHGKGIVMVGATAGSLALQYAANASGTITVAKGSLIKARRTG